MEKRLEVTGIAVNTDTYGISVSDGERTETYQIPRVSRTGKIYSKARVMKAALALFEME